MEMAPHLCGVAASGGVRLGTGALAELRDSSPDRHDVVQLRARMAADGYLFLPGLLARDEVLAAREEVTRRLADGGFLAAGSDPTTARAGASRPDKAFRATLAHGNAPLARVLYDGAMIQFFDSFFGEPARHYDFTWFRCIAPGPGTPPHADVVFMGRAERARLFTAWTPLGDIDTVQGGLMILEGSAGVPALTGRYYALDVDARCTNTADARDEWEKGSNGWLGADPEMVGHRLGGRWLTADFRAGDVLLFSVFTVHASLDNRSDCYRLSADSRYQPASTAADERWIGSDPPGRGPRGKRDLIC